MDRRINRMSVTVGTAKALEKADRKRLSNTSVKEKLETITYLRECFYGAEATTGRFQRFYKVFKRA